MMNAFQVWVRPLGESCRIRVNGVRNAEWLLKRLGTSFAIDNAEPCHETLEPGIVTFKVPCEAPQARNRLQKALSSIPEVDLMIRPE